MTRLLSVFSHIKMTSKISKLLLQNVVAPRETRTKTSMQPAKSVPTPAIVASVSAAPMQAQLTEQERRNLKIQQLLSSSAVAAAAPQNKKQMPAARQIIPKSVPTPVSAAPMQVPQTEQERKNLMIQEILRSSAVAAALKRVTFEYTRFLQEK